MNIVFILKIKQRRLFYHSLQKQHHNEDSLYVLCLSASSIQTWSGLQGKGGAALINGHVAGIKQQHW